ncbi:MAG: hypothetical protein V4596_02465 [Bdellovibrionota bacterium]
MKRIFLFLTILCLLSTSCKNAFEEMSSKDSEAAILYSARQHLSAGRWTEALSEFEKLPAATLAETEVVVDRASAYSGRCGLDFLGLSDLIENIGTTPLMELLMTNFPATSAANYADCKLAEDLLKTVADTSGVVSTEDGRFLMAFNALAKIGVILNFRADADENDAVDAGWDPCDGNGATDLPAAEVSEVGTGIVLFYKNLQGFSFGSDITSEIEAICTDPMVDGSPVDFCDEEDATAYTNAYRQLIRGFIRDDTDGIGLAIDAGQGVAVSACEP